MTNNPLDGIVDNMNMSPGIVRAVLIYVGSNPNCTRRDMQEYWHLSRKATEERIDSARKLGLLSSVESDGRGTLLYTLTDKGRHSLDTGELPVSGQFRRMYEELNPDCSKDDLNDAILQFLELDDREQCDTLGEHWVRLHSEFVEVKMREYHRCVIGGRAFPFTLSSNDPSSWALQYAIEKDQERKTGRNPRFDPPPVIQQSDGSLKILALEGESDAAALVRASEEGNLNFPNRAERRAIERERLRNSGYVSKRR